MAKGFTVARLTAYLIANTQGFESGLNKANYSLQTTQTKWRNALSKTERNFDAVGKKAALLEGTFVDLGQTAQSAGVFISGAFSLQKIIQYTDTWRQLQGRLGIVTENMTQLKKVQDDLFSVAQRTGQPLEALTDLYQRLSLSMTEAQRNQFDMVKIADIFSMSLAITGESAESARAAIIQFSQAVGGDFKTSGQELNSIIEQSPRFAQLLATNMQTTTAGLKKMAGEGKLSTEMVFGAALKGYGQIKQEFDGLSMTVGRSFSQLDNAFLKYIGQNDLAMSGTSSLAAALSSLADNFNMVANILLLIGGGMTAKYVAGLISARAATLSVAAAATAEQMAITRLSPLLNEETRVTYALRKSANAMNGALGEGVVAVGLSGKAAVVTTSRFGRLSGAVSQLGKGIISLVGGPFNAWVLGVSGIIYATNKFSSSIAAMTDLTQAVGATVDDIKNSFEQYSTASEESKKAIIASSEAKIQAMQREGQALLKIIELYRSENFIFRKTRNLGSFLGTGEASVNSLSDQYDKVKSSVSSLSAELQKLKELKENSSVQGSSILDKSTSDIKNRSTSVEKYAHENDALKNIQNLVDQLEHENQVLDIQIKYYGQKESLIQRVTAEQEFATEASKAQAGATEEERKKLNELTQLEKARLDQRQRQNEILEDMKKKEEDAQKETEAHADAVKELGYSFESAFENAIIQGEKLRSVIGGLLADIGKMILRKTVTQPIGAAVSSIISKNLPSFDVGTDFVPHDMVAQIHRGEAVLTPDEANIWRSGNSSGNVYNIDARGADQAAVVRLQNALMVLAGPGVVEQRVRSAQRRGAL